MGDLLKVGLTGVMTHQTALSTTGNNISSANVPGYSRQRAEIVSNIAQGSAEGYIGTGSRVETISRIADRFAIDQLRRDTSTYNRVETLRSFVGQLDKVFADANTGITPAMNTFFSSIQAAADDPASMPARQLVLSESDNLIERFHSLYQRVEDQRSSLNGQVSDMVGEISTIAKNVADLNRSIETATGQAGGNPPNDLMDQRDELLRKLSELVSVQVLPTDNNKVNVSIGSGQPLVLGTSYNSVVALDNELDPRIQDIGFTTGNVTLRYGSDSITGGKLGGILEFRDQVLQPSFNSLGRLALTFAQSFNDQHELGMDLDGQIGQRYFGDINTPALMSQRVVPSSTNAVPADRVLSVEISDVTQLSDSDYELRFVGPTTSDFSIIRLSDDATVASGTLPGALPQDIQGVDGMTIHLTSGSFQPGDRFLLQPTRDGAEQIMRELDNTRDIALAMPIRTETSRINQGTGTISQGDMLEVYQQDGTTPLSSFGTTGNPATFTVPATMAPPVLIRFTSATTYDVLNNSDPAKPVDFNPPLRNMKFVPGSPNAVFATDPLATAVTSSGTDVGTFVIGAIGSTTNGDPGETVTITTTNPNTGAISVQTTTLPANQSAKVNAAQLSTLSGVEATANTQAKLTVTDDGAGALAQISLNGVSLTDPLQGAVPNPVTVDFLRDRINQSGVLKAQGVFAVSDGTSLTVRSVSGEDLTFDMVGGDATDFLTVTEANGIAVAGGDIAVGNSATIGGTVDVMLDGNVALTSTGGIFTAAPTATTIFTGYQVTLDGAPVAGDEFKIAANRDGTSDNRNAFGIGALQTRATGSNGQSYGEAYSELVEFVGTTTSQARINSEASKVLMDQSQSARDSTSGVNLDEEAARLIQFEQAYSASAQVISVARQLFDTLLGSIK